MAEFTSPLSLARKLISFPSYLDNNHDEIPVLDFLVDFLSEYLPNMKVEKQYLNGSKRYNIVMKGNNKPKLFALGHTDTVQPNDEWLTNPIQPIIKEDILFGLGSADMKSS